MKDEELKERLRKIGLPLYRYNHFNKSNLEWMMKKLPKYYKDHEYYDVVITEVSRRLNNKEYYN